MPIFQCRDEGAVNRCVYDLIYKFRIKFEDGFESKASEADEVGRTYELNSLRDLYDFRHFEIHEFLIKNRWEKYVDLEDPEY